MPPRKNATRGALPNFSAECSIAAFFSRLRSLKRYSYPAAHTDADIDRTLAACRESLASVTS